MESWMYSHKEQLSLHLPQKFVATDDNSALRTEMLSLEPQEENRKNTAKAPSLALEPSGMARKNQHSGSHGQLAS